MKDNPKNPKKRIIKPKRNVLKARWVKKKQDIIRRISLFSGRRPIY